MQQHGNLLISLDVSSVGIFMCEICVCVIYESGSYVRTQVKNTQWDPIGSKVIRRSSKRWNPTVENHQNPGTFRRLPTDGF